jgi:hypothetical protein
LLDYNFIFLTGLTGFLGLVSFLSAPAPLREKMALHGLSKKLPEKKHLRNCLNAYFSG